MQRRTIIVDGPLAFRMRRIVAARAGEIGTEIITLPLLAARLSGGFARPAAGEDVEQAVRAALDQGGFAVLDPCRDLPGMVRALSASLQTLWREGRLADGLEARDAKAGDVALVEERVRATLPQGVLIAPDLALRASAHLAIAATVLGEVELDRVFSVAPVWRDLLNALSKHTRLTWRAPPSDAGWFGGEHLNGADSEPAAPTYVECANARAEAVEALRWLRAHLALGSVRPHEIAICAAATQSWDDHFLALAADAGLPLHFAHGRPALATNSGQACAALAELLLRGLTQNRMRRLLAHSQGRAPLLRNLPGDWMKGLSAAASLTNVEHWRAALDFAFAQRQPGSTDPRPMLLPAIELLSRGGEAAAEAGAKLLPPAAQPIWAGALRRAPVAAIEHTLRDLRFADETDPGAAAAWGPASLIAGAPRPYLRMLGLTARGWPRPKRDDPFLTERIADDADDDRALFAHLRARARGECIVSRSRRSPEGGRLAASPLVERVASWTPLARDRRPAHAFNAADRLMARPEEARERPAIAAATSSWRNAINPELTGHDGRVHADHPLIVATLAKPQSATSLRLMLRDPLAYLWRYALGLKTPDAAPDGLALEPREYGVLLHDLLARAVARLEPTPGLAAASNEEVVAAIAFACDALAPNWPLKHATPPPLLWRHTLARARADASRALEMTRAANSRSWAELAFGESVDEGGPDLPWRPTAEVALEKSGLKIRGAIDRLDLSPERNVRVTDYKTGRPPSEDSFLLRGGLELQRIIYTIAVRRLLADVNRIQAQLVYLNGDAKPMREIDMNATAFEGFVTTAVAVQKRGDTVSGDEAFAENYDLRLMLPAFMDYAQVKRAKRKNALKDLSRIWGAE